MTSELDERLLRLRDVLDLAHLLSIAVSQTAPFRFRGVWAQIPCGGYNPKSIHGSKRYRPHDWAERRRELTRSSIGI